jgi:hypothetical protein
MRTGDNLTGLYDAIGHNSSAMPNFADN